MHNRFFELVDTGGMGAKDVDNLSEQIEAQIEIAIDSADVCTSCATISAVPVIVQPPASRVTGCGAQRVRWMRARSYLSSSSS